VIPDTRVAVLGLGMMGGSLARGLAARGARVIGLDRDEGQVEAAMREGVVQDRLDGDLTGIETSEVVLLALPVHATIEMLPRLSGRLASARLVMDVASTKRTIVAAAERAGLGATFVGAHPLTGSHRSGWGASRESLFEDARIFLCPTASTTPAARQLAESFWRELRAGSEWLDAALHDEQMAWRSHLPHLLSTALALTLRDAGVRRSALGPGGRDMTRLAGGSADMWASIVGDNAASILAAIDACDEQLASLRVALTRDDADLVHRWLEDGRSWFDGSPDAVLTRPKS
jgi:prephenate dehydrogenase